MYRLDSDLEGKRVGIYLRVPPDAADRAFFADPLPQILTLFSEPPRAAFVLSACG
jgi:hypothetical protein